MQERYLTKTQLEELLGLYKPTYKTRVGSKAWRKNKAY